MTRRHVNDFHSFFQLNHSLAALLQYMHSSRVLATSESEFEGHELYTHLRFQEQRGRRGRADVKIIIAKLSGSRLSQAQSILMHSTSLLIESRGNNHNHEQGMLPLAHSKTNGGAAQSGSITETVETSQAFGLFNSASIYAYVSFLSKVKSSFKYTSSAILN